MRYQFIQKHRASFPVTKMCRSFNIFPSGFYRWRKRPYSNRQKENDRIRERIRSLYNEHNGMAGSPMITADLRSEASFSSVGKNRVARHMKAMGAFHRKKKTVEWLSHPGKIEPVLETESNRSCSIFGQRNVN